MKLRYPIGSRYEMKKPLGFGGNGIAIHYRYFDPDADGSGRDLLVKIPKHGRIEEYLLREEQTTKVSCKSIHAICRDGTIANS